MPDGVFRVDPYLVPLNYFGLPQAQVQQPGQPMDPHEIQRQIEAQRAAMQQFMAAHIRPGVPGELVDALLGAHLLAVDQTGMTEEQKADAADKERAKQAAQREASARAKALLDRLLDDEQRADYQQYRAFIVRVTNNGAWCATRLVRGNELTMFNHVPKQNDAAPAIKFEYDRDHRGWIGFNWYPTDGCGYTGYGYEPEDLLVTAILRTRAEELWWPTRCCTTAHCPVPVPVRDKAEQRYVAHLNARGVRFDEVTGDTFHVISADACDVTATTTAIFDNYGTG